MIISKCPCCKHPLTTIASAKAGIGPVCARKNGFVTRKITAGETTTANLAARHIKKDSLRKPIFAACRKGADATVVASIVLRYLSNTEWSDDSVLCLDVLKGLGFTDLASHIIKG